MDRRPQRAIPRRHTLVAVAAVPMAPRIVVLRKPMLGVISTFVLQADLWQVLVVGLLESLLQRTRAPPKVPGMAHNSRCNLGRYTSGYVRTFRERIRDEVPHTEENNMPNASSSEGAPGALGAFRGAALAVAVLVIGCNDRQVVATSPAPPTAPGAMLIDPVVTPISTFDADVNITFTGASPAMASEPNPTRGIGYHVTERLDTYGRWVSDFSLGTYRATSEATDPGDNPPRIGRITGYYSNLNPAFTDVVGAAVPMEAPPTPDVVAPSPDVAPADPAPTPTMPPPPPGSSFSLTPSAQPATRVSSVSAVADIEANAWLDKYVVSSRGAERTKRRLERFAGAGVRDAGGKLRFKVTKAEREIELVFDDLSGAVTEVTMREGGVLRARTINSYERRPEGLSVLTRAVTTLNRASDPTHPLVAEIDYANIQLKAK